MVLRNILRQWFATSKKPTAEQFSEFFDSFWHKSEDKIKVTDVENLATTLAGKAPLNHGHELNQVNGLPEALANKVDKVAGEGLTPEKFTLEEKQKLAGLSVHWKGSYTSLAALQAAHPTGAAGDEAEVDNPGADVQRYVWDATDSKWVVQQGVSTAETATSIRTKLESLTGDARLDAAAIKNLPASADLSGYVEVPGVGAVAVSTSTFNIALNQKKTQVLHLGIVASTNTIAVSSNDTGRGFGAIVTVTANGTAAPTITGAAKHPKSGNYNITNGVDNTLYLMCKTTGAGVRQVLYIWG